MKKYNSCLIVTFITLLVSISFFWINGTYFLNGQFEKFYLSSNMFGVPQKIQDHGITSFYKAKHECGWDGQFYYYIANDIFCNLDTRSHMDSDAYRYQRVGVPLFAKLVSLLFFQDWVSPFVYYISSLFILLLATFFGAKFFSKNGLNPYLILFWSLGLGSQLTLLNGLPDVGADSFLILAIVSLFNERKLLWVIFATFAALSREAYVLMPAFLFGGYTVAAWIYPLERKKCFQMVLAASVPLVVFCIWQIFLRLKFGVSPASQAYGILGAPFIHLMKFLIGGLTGTHSLLGNIIHAKYAVVGLVCFALLMLISLCYLTCLLKNNLKSFFNHFSVKIINLLSLALTFTTLNLMYWCFGPTVMMHYTGYMKAATLFLFVLPWSFIYIKTNFEKVIIFFLLLCNLYFMLAFSHRLLAGPYEPIGDVDYAKEEPKCLKQPKSSLEIEHIYFRRNYAKFPFIFIHNKDLIIYLDIKIKNLSNNSLLPYQGKGGVNLSYHWLKKSNSERLVDGIRTPIKEELLPKKTTSVRMKILPPGKSGDYVLVISLMQEGCSWFYEVDPANSLKMPMSF